MLSTIRKCLYLLKPESKLKWIAVIIVAIIATGFESIGALLVFLLLGMLVAPDTPAQLPVIGDVRELAFAPRGDQLLVWLAALVGSFFIVRGLILILQLYIENRLAENAGARLSVRLLDGYLSMPFILHLNRNSAELIRNIYSSVGSVTHEAIISSTRLLSNIVLVLGMLGVLFYADSAATLFAMGFLGVLIVILLRIIFPRLKSLGREAQHLSQENIKIIQQSLQGVREVTLFDRASFFIKAFARRQKATARVIYMSRVAKEVPRLLIETVLMVFIAGFLVFSVTVQRSPQETVAILGLFAYAALRLEPALHRITQSLNSIRFASAAVDSVYEDMVLTSSERAKRPIQVADSLLPGKVIHEIALHDVEYRYKRLGSPVLQGINLTIAAGESIGIVGPTGGGKSTLIDVITGLLPPTRGRVKVDGVDIQACTAAWQRRLGVVPQTTFLIDDSLRRNIAFGVLSEEIDEDLVNQAVESAQLSAFVKELPDGLDTVVGERGVRLSGGQRQRIAIARALYRKPSVLVFDEGTSALDNITEAEFIQALTQLGNDHTIITIAHRLTTVRKCDRIVFIEAGRITDIGTYEVLSLRNPHFQDQLHANERPSLEAEEPNPRDPGSCERSLG